MTKSPIFRFIFLFTFVANASAGLEKNPSVKIGVIAVEPFSIENEGLLSGIHVDFLKRLCVEANFSCSFSRLPYQRVITSLETGKLDLTLIFKRDKFNNVKEISKVFGFDVLLLTRPNSKIESPKDLEGKKIGVIRNARYNPAFEKIKGIEKFPIENYARGQSMLKLGRLDGMVITEPAYMFLKSEEQKDLTPTLNFGPNYNYLYASDKLAPEVVSKIKKESDRLLKGDLLKKILESYHHKE